MVESLIPYIVAGLNNNERCMLGAAAPLYADELRSELAKVVPDLEQRLKREQISIFDHHEWFVGNPSSNPVDDLLRTEEKALSGGYKGLRCGGNISWITKKDWGCFCDYESRVSEALRHRKILALCSYDFAKCAGSEVFDAIQSHHFTVAKSGQEWGLFKIARR